MQSAETTRFAPSPTGELHLGHAWSAHFAHDAARATGGRFLVRIEDLDKDRCQARYAAAILADLDWLGLAWDGPVRYQSQHLPVYRTALKALTEQGLTYPCFCTRGEQAREIQALRAAPQGTAGARYPGTCSQLAPQDRAARLEAGEPHALRLDIGKALHRLGRVPLLLEETGAGPGGESGLLTAQPDLLGDLVLGRKGLGVSYHLAVVLDDAAQGVSLVTRGDDLFAAAHVQRLLQALLKLPMPRYRHHPLLRDPTGRRLAKRDRDQTLAYLRGAGASPKEILQLWRLG